MSYSAGVNPSLCLGLESALRQKAVEIVTVTFASVVSLLRDTALYDWDSVFWKQLQTFSMIIPISLDFCFDAIYLVTARGGSPQGPLIFAGSPLPPLGCGYCERCAGERGFWELCEVRRRITLDGVGVQGKTADWRAEICRRIEVAAWTAAARKRGWLQRWKWETGLSDGLEAGESYTRVQASLLCEWVPRTPGVSLALLPFSTWYLMLECRLPVKVSD